MFKRKGIVLITTLAFITVVIMFSVLIAQQGKDTLKSGVGFSDSEQAYLAALSGIEFAKGNLSISKQWGTGSLSHTLKDTDNKIKIESGSNWVKGYVGYNSDDNYSSMFSISFVPNASEFGVCQYPSCNNINNDNDIKASSSNGYHRDIPANCFYIVCKGTAGKAVKHVEAVLSNAGPSVLSSGTMISGKIDINGIDSNKFVATEEYKDLNSFYDSRAFLSILRNDKKSKDNIVTSKGTLTAFSKDSSVSINSPESGVSNNASRLLNLSDKESGSVIINSDNFTLGNNLQKDSITGLSHNSNSVFDASDLQEMDEYSKATAGISCENTINGGTYVYIKDCTKDSVGNKNNGGKWVYIDNSTTIASKPTYEDRAQSIVELLNADSSDLQIPKNNNSISFGKNNKSGKGVDRTVTVSDNLIVKGDVNFIVVDKVNTSVDGDKAFNYEPSNDTVDFTIKSKKSLDSKSEDPVFMCDKNLFIDGEVTGSGKIFANGNMSFNSGSSLETKAQSGVAVWAKDNVDIQPAKSISNETLETEAGQKRLESALKKEYKKNGKTDDEAAKEAAISTNSYIEDKTDNNSTVNTEEQFPGNNSANKNLELVIQEDNFDLVGNCFSIKIPNGFSCNNYDEYLGCTNDKIYFSDDLILINSARYGEVNFKLENGTDVYTFQISVKRDDKGGTIDINDFNFEIFKVEGQSKDKFIKFDIEANGNPKYSEGNINSSVCSHGSKIDSNVDFPFNLNVNGKASYDLSSFPKASGPVDKIDSSQLPETEPPATKEPSSDKPTDEEINTIVTKAIKSNPTKLIGTVYSANGDINIDGGYAEFDILGALISLNGNLTMENILRASLTYDPDYVPFFKDKGILTNSVFTRVF